VPESEDDIVDEAEDTDDTEDEEDEDVEDAELDAEGAADADETPSTVKLLIEYIARSLVENPDDVVVTDDWDGYRYVVHLDVAETDMGKVIGRGGRVAEAMRSLLKVAAARQDARAVLDIGD
jgi:predicted RNA-binding protein YlqC (UPF0109 family)